MARHDRGLGQTVQRVDRCAWKPDASRKVVHPNGMVDVPGVATRTGVLLYDDQDERGQPVTVREIRPASEVFDPASLATLVGVPVTIEHPGDGPDPDGGAGEVTTANVRQLAHGWVLRVEPDESTGLVWVWVRLASEDVLAAIQGGKVELSCGYEAVLVDPMDPAWADLIAAIGPEPGVAANGDRYDLVQTRIRYNHLAVVDAARAGPVARLHLDRKPMKTKITINGKTHEVAAFMAKAIRSDSLDSAAQAKAKADALEVGEITIEGQDLTLPKSTIDQILAMLGAGASAGPSTPEPEPMPAGDMGMDPTKMGDAEDPDEPEAMADMADPKADALTQARVDAMVARALARLQPAAARKIADAVVTTSRERSALEREASLVLGVRHDYAGQDDHAVAVAVLKADGSPRLARAETLAQAARKGDQMAAGRLRQMMDDVLDRRRDAQDSSQDLATWVFSASAAQVHADASDDETPERVRVAREKRDAARKPAA